MHHEAIDHLSRRDPILRRLIQRVGPCVLKPKIRRSPYESLVRAVVYQQLSGKAAETILGRVVKLFPGRFPTPAQILEMDPEKMRGAGLSRAKTAAIKDIALKTTEGVVPKSSIITKLNDDEIVQRLTSIRGVGPWTVEMYLMFTLGRPDVFPVSDYGVRKGFALTYGWKELPTPKELLPEGDRWRPHRSVASWYMWRALELPK
jgi:DNA-3-methyladenine glycosylase II